MKHRDILLFAKDFWKTELILMSEQGPILDYAVGEYVESKISIIELLLGEGHENYVHNG